LKEIGDYLRTIGDGIPLPHSRNSLSLWHKLQDGILYQAGGWYDQPSWYTDDMGYIDLLVEYEEIPYKIKDCIKQLETISKKPSPIPQGSSILQSV
jgi:hypothetical protein